MTGHNIQWYGASRIFYKVFDVDRGILRGKYQSKYNYNIGWNYPTSLKVDIKDNRLHGGAIHVSIDNNYGGLRFPVIALKKDLVGNGFYEAAFKKIYIPKQVYADIILNSPDTSIRYDTEKLLAEFRKEHKGLMA